MKSYIYHLLIALALTQVIWLCFYLTGCSLGIITGAVVAAALFYGREHSQEERKLADSLNISHQSLFEKYPSLALKLLLPVNWSKHNLYGFLVPLVGVSLLAIAWYVW